MIRSFIITALLVCLSFSSALAGSSDYKKILKKWTRSDEVYRAENLKMTIQWHATLLVDSVLSSQAAHYAKVYQISEAEKNQKLAQLKKRKGKEFLAFVSFYSGEQPFDDLTDEKAKWDLRLSAGGVTFRPTRIEKISKRPTPLDTFYFPYLHNWSRGYYVWFSPEVQFYTKPWVLSVHGPKSKSELIWK